MTPDFIAKVEPGLEKCDFCSSPDVKWAFPCRDFQTPTEVAEATVFRADGSRVVREMSMHAVQTGDWAACPACKALIMRGDRERLARRSAKRLQRSLAAENTIMPFKNLLATIRRRHDEFWSHREGEPFPADQTERIRRGDAS